MKKLLLPLFLLIVATATAQQNSNYIPPGIPSTSIQGYIQNPSDTLTRKIYHYYGNGLADRMVRWQDLATFGVSSFNGRTGSITPLIGDYGLFYLQNQTATPQTFSGSINGDLFFNPSSGTYPNIVINNGGFTLTSALGVGNGINSVGHYWTNNGFTISLLAPTLASSDKFVTMQNASGILALTADIPTSLPTPNALTIDNSGAGASSGTTFNGSVARTISHNTIGALPISSPTYTGTLTGPNITLNPALNSNFKTVNVTAGGFAMGYVVNATNGSAFYYGLEGPTGGTVATGSAQYAALVGNNYNRPLQLFANNDVKMTVSSTGVDAPALNSTTQSANDNSTKVATTAYVDALKTTGNTWTPTQAFTNVIEAEAGVNSKSGYGTRYYNVANSFYNNFGVTTLTGNHSVLLPNGSGTVALTKDNIAGSYSGVGTATTTFTVTIGSTQPNTTYKVQATPSNTLSAALFYVNNKTTTTFDVVYLVGLTGTVTFDWLVSQ